MSAVRWTIILCTLFFHATTCYETNSTFRLNLETLLSSPGPDGVQRHVSKKLLEYWPWFVPHHEVSEACWNESIAYLHDLQMINMDALKIWDASAKFSSGILNGNVNQYGDYDLCLEGGGRYCLAYLQLDLVASEVQDLFKIHSMVHSFHAFKSTLDDPGHRVPRYSTIHWGLCVPRSCTPRDVELTLGSVLSSASSNTGLSLKARIFPEMCPAVPKPSIPTTTIFVGSLFLLFLGFVGVATLYDFIEEEGVKNKSTWLQVVEGFSLRKNTKKLLESKESGDGIKAVHGIRFFNAIMLYFSHKSLSVFYNPFMNRTHMSILLGASWTIVTRAASLYTDPFILMSGLLTSYSLLKTNNPPKLHKEIISRLFRLLPSLATIIVFCTFILPYLGSGPQWPLVIESHAKICKKYWWRNLLLIHNYFGFKNMCLTHTHHIGIDTQLYVVSLLVVPFLQRWPKRSLQMLGVVAVMSTLLRFYTTYAKELNLYIHYGNPVSRMFDTADYSYILPTHRATVYVMGIVLGYILRHTGRNYHLKKSLLGAGWMVAVLCLYLSLIPWSKMGDMSYIYNSLDAANYSAFAPIFWCLFFSWGIFTEHTGNSMALWSKFLGNKWFLVSTRLSYSFYLTQFPVFFYNVGRVRTSSFFSIFIMTDVLELAGVLAVTVALTLLVEMPFQHIRSLIFSRSKDMKPITNGVKHNEAIRSTNLEKNTINGLNGIYTNGITNLESNGLHKRDSNANHESNGLINHISKKEN